MQVTQARLLDELVRVGGPYMFTVNSEALRADSLTPTLPRRMEPPVSAFGRGASLIYDFETASSPWLRSAGTVDDVVAVSTDMKLVPASSPQELLARLRHTEMLTQFQAVRRYSEPIDVWPEPTVAWTLLLGLLIVILRRMPPHSRAYGTEIAGDRRLPTPNS